MSTCFGGAAQDSDEDLGRHIRVVLGSSVARPMRAARPWVRCFLQGAALSRRRRQNEPSSLKRGPGRHIQRGKAKRAASSIPSLPRDKVRAVSKVEEAVLSALRCSVDVASGPRDSPAQPRRERERNGAL